MSRSSRLFACVLLCASACSRADVAADSGPDLPLAPFSSRFRQVATITPAQSDSAPIVFVSGAAARNGVIALSDPGQSAVTLVRRDGSVVRRIGRRGRGPSEFNAPVAPRFDAYGRLHVLDVSLRRITVFSPDGAPQRSFSVAPYGIAGDMELLPDGGYAIATLGTQPEVLIRLDSLGNETARHLPLAAFRPRGTRDVPQWRNILRPSVSVAGDTAFVVLTLSDSVWSVDLATGRVHSRRVAVPGYARPAAPARPLGDPSAYGAWMRTFSTAATVVAGDGSVTVPFVNGIYLSTAPSTLAYRDPAGTWTALEGAPPIVGRWADTLLVLQNPEEDVVRLGLYVRR